MRVTSMLALALAGTAAASSLPRSPAARLRTEGTTIEAGEQDGIYFITLGPDGQVANKTMQPLPAAPAVRERSASLVARMPISKSVCTNGPMNEVEWNAAWRAFTNTCDPPDPFQVAPNSIHVVKVGSAIAWMCSWGGWNPCNRGEYDEFVNVISNQCGGLTTGFADISDWAKTYGRNNVGQTFCNYNG